MFDVVLSSYGVALTDRARAHLLVLAFIDHEDCWLLESNKITRRILEPEGWSTEIFRYF